jgi:SAM-dependent methyltransferase
MIARRPRGAAPVVWAVAEALPFADQRFDAAMALWTIHHWSDLDQGLAELRRVARRSEVVSASTVIDHVWLTADYRPGMARDRRPDIAPEVIAHKLGGVVRIEPLLLPRDCVDGFGEAYWARPEAYLTPDVRAAMSCFQLLDPAEVQEGLRRLAADLTSGAWDARYGDLRDRPGGRSSCATCAISWPWRQFRHLCARRHAAMRKEAPMKQPITLPSSPVRADRVAHKPRVRARTQTR